jgi:hypothetical protein
LFRGMLRTALCGNILGDGFWNVPFLLEKRILVDNPLVFISYNTVDKLQARLIATSLVQQGSGVWFDEWDIGPGESITGGIEKGITRAHVFVLLWSQNARKSNWVGTELRAYLRRRVDNQTLRIIPVMLDDTPLPALVADYKGIRVTRELPLEEITSKILGYRPDHEIAALLQSRLLELSNYGQGSMDPLPYLVCPRCGSTNLERRQSVDEERGDMYLDVWCEDCKWTDSTEI